MDVSVHITRERSVVHCLPLQLSPQCLRVWFTTEQSTMVSMHRSTFKLRSRLKG